MDSTLRTLCKERKECGTLKNNGVDEVGGYKVCAISNSHFTAMFGRFRNAAWNLILYEFACAGGDGGLGQWVFLFAKCAG
jgi:hypothetical protein